MRFAAHNDPTCEQLLKNQGYDIVTIGKTARSVVATLTKDGQPYFFKKALTEIVNRSLANEAAWYRQLGPMDNLALDIPQLITEGEDDGNYWLIREGYDEKNRVADADENYLVNDFKEKYLVKTIEFLDQLSKLKVVLPSDDYPIAKPIEDRLFDLFRLKMDPKPTIKRITEYDAKQINFDDSKIQEIIDKTKFDGYGLAYTDYKPWEFFRSKDTLALIDAELASNFVPKYYDIASYYTRLITVLGQKELAAASLEIFLDKLKNKEEFRDQLPALVGWILVGEWRDAKKANRNDDGCKFVYEKVISGYF